MKSEYMNRHGVIRTDRIQPRQLRRAVLRDTISGQSSPRSQFLGERVMKTAHVVLLAIALPASLVAQAPSATAAANPITETFRTRTMTYQRNLAQAFDSIPESKFGYKPTPAQLTIGYIAQHLASDNYFFCDNFGAMKSARAAEDTTTAD